MSTARAAGYLRLLARRARRDADTLEKLALEIDEPALDSKPADVNDLDVARAKRVKERLRRLGERS